MFEMLFRFPADDTLVVHQSGTLTRSEFARSVAHRVSQWQQQGLSPGERIVLALPNSVELLIAYYACIASGLIAVPVSSSLSLRQISAIVDHASASLIVTGKAGQFFEGITDLDWGCRLEIFEFTVAVLKTPAAPADVMPEWPDSHPAMIFYTSGSTGKPKGVLYSHRTLRENSRIFQQQFGLCSDDRSVICHCMAHNFGFAQLTAPFLDAGGSIHIVDFANIEQAAAALQSGVTFLRLIPWFGIGLLEYCLEHDISTPDLRFCLVGGDRVPEAFFVDCQRAFGIRAAEMIGLTETNTYAVSPITEEALKPGSVGLPFPGVAISIRDSDGQALGTGQVGEIWVKTPAIMEGYWKDEKQTRSTMRGDWFITGDAGHRDDEGYLWFDARIKNIIICDGDNIYPSEIEREIIKHDAVKHAAVIGLPHETHGETVAAAVVTHPGQMLHIDELNEFLRSRLGETGIPRRLVILKSMPRVVHGKLDRKQLEKQFKTGDWA